jgi:5-methylcytosine-specific restriction protein B
MAHPSTTEIPSADLSVESWKADLRVYEFSNRWMETCLIKDGSILNPAASVWTPSNFQQFKKAFIENFDAGDGAFLEKLKKQLADYDVGVTQLAAELFLIHIFCDSGTLGKTKVSQVNEILGWKDLPQLDESYNELLGLGFVQGGIAYKQHFPQLGFLTALGVALKSKSEIERKKICTDPWQFKSFMEAVSMPPEFKKDATQKNMLMHFVHPDTFEPVMSVAAKLQMAKAFDPTGSKAEDVDKRLIRVRQLLTPRFGSGFGFYQDDIRSLWEGKSKPNPPIVEPVKVPVSSPIAIKDIFLEPSEVETILYLWESKKNLVLQGAPGVGKTFAATRLAQQLVGAGNTSRIAMIQFHQSYSYEDFVQGWRPAGSGSFELKNGHFYQFAKKAASDPVRENKYVFIIDEVNRGNLSRIFGEVLSLLEADKRGQELQLTYSEEGFSVPNNLYLLGLMNTADRSLALVDYALRRRFAFVTLQPKFESPSFASELEKMGVPTTGITTIRDRMTKLNSAIAEDTRNLGSRYVIGHSFFCPRNAVADWRQWFEGIVKFEIAPLLEEYWYDAPQTVQKHVNELLDSLL